MKGTGLTRREPNTLTNAFGGFLPTAIITSELENMVITEKKVLYIKARPLIDINKASAAELNNLNLNTEQVDKIIAYRTLNKIVAKEELVKNGFLSTAEFIKIKDCIKC